VIHYWTPEKKQKLKKEGLDAKKENISLFLSKIETKKGIFKEKG